MAQAISTLASIEALATSESTRQAPAAAVALLEDTRALVTDPSTRALPRELQATITDLRAILQELQQGRAVEHLTAALKDGAAAASEISSASEELPALVDDLRTLAAKANSLEAEELIRSVNKLMISADEVIGTEQAVRCPHLLRLWMRYAPRSRHCATVGWWITPMRPWPRRAMRHSRLPTLPKGCLRCRRGLNGLSRGQKRWWRLMEIAPTSIRRRWMYSEKSNLRRARCHSLRARSSAIRIHWCLVGNKENFCISVSCNGIDGLFRVQCALPDCSHAG